MNLRALPFALAATVLAASSGAYAATLDNGYFVDTTNPNTIVGYGTLPSSRLTPNSPAGVGRPAFGTFDIVVNYTNTPTASQAAAFAAAEAFWEARIHGYESQAIADAMAFLGGLQIEARLEAIDGVGNTLGSAGATSVVLTNGNLNETPSVNNFMVASTGTMRFDTADLGALEADGTLDDVILHEMAHVMGFSDFFWDFVSATDGTGSDLSYTGPIALETYNNEFNNTSLFIPVEERGGAGTAFAHWDEVNFAAHGNENNPELMTGFLDANPYVSDTTLAAFDDIGYVTDVTLQASVVPLPAPAFMLLTGLSALAVRRRKS